MIIAVISKKGGVGKTTTSVNLAAAMALRGLRVLVVDLDPNAGASMSLGVTKDALGPGSADLLLRDVSPETLVRPTDVDGLFVMPASVDLRSAEPFLDGQYAKELVLDRRLRRLRGRFDLIFLDCPSSIGLLTRNALAAADQYLVPTAPQFLAFEGLDHLIQTVDRLSYRTGNPTQLLGVALTMVDYRLIMTRKIVAKLREELGKRVFAVEIRTNVSLAEAPAFGQTIYQYKPRATGARAYQLLADEILMSKGILESPPSPFLEMVPA